MSTVQMLIDRLGHRLGRALALDDANFGIVASTAQTGALDDARAASILSRRPSPEVEAWLRSLRLDRVDEVRLADETRQADEARGAEGAQPDDEARPAGGVRQTDGVREAQRTRPVEGVDYRRVPGNAEYRTLDRVCFPVRARKRLLGYLWAIDEPPLAEAEIARIAESVPELAVQLEWQGLPVRPALGEVARLALAFVGSVGGEALREAAEAGLLCPEAASDGVTVRVAWLAAGDRGATRARLQTVLEETLGALESGEALGALESRRLPGAGAGAGADVGAGAGASGDGEGDAADDAASRVASGDAGSAARHRLVFVCAGSADPVPALVRSARRRGLRVLAVGAASGPAAGHGGAGSGAAGSGRADSRMEFGPVAAWGAGAGALTGAELHARAVFAGELAVELADGAAGRGLGDDPDPEPGASPAHPPRRPRSGHAADAPPMLAWEQLGAWTLLRGRDATAATVRDLSPAVAELLARGRDDLADTWLVYLDENRDATNTCARLHIGRATLYHRLRRIRECVGFEAVSDGWATTSAHLALRLWARSLSRAW
ncbi:MAG: helix-turn-helix domain-containing protein [Leucobacter sp.]